MPDMPREVLQKLKTLIRRKKMTMVIILEIMEVKIVQQTIWYHLEAKKNKREERSDSVAPKIQAPIHQMRKMIPLTNNSMKIHSMRKTLIQIARYTEVELRSFNMLLSMIINWLNLRQDLKMLKKGWERWTIIIPIKTLEIPSLQWYKYFLYPE